MWILILVLTEEHMKQETLNSFFKKQNHNQEKLLEEDNCNINSEYSLNIH